MHFSNTIGLKKSWALYYYKYNIKQFILFNKLQPAEHPLPHEVLKKTQNHPVGK
jgi:hypothetical protein